MEGWKDGTAKIRGMMEQWKKGKTEEWKDGRLEEWEERWNIGRLEEWKVGRLTYYYLDNYRDLWDKQRMDRKNINRGFRKLRVWQDAVLNLSRKSRC
jgi:hypothetical protein